MELLKKNISHFKNNTSLFLIIALLSSCSSMESLKFWPDAEIDTDEPKKLEKFSSSYTIKNNWKISFKGGDNTLGNFIPSFNANNIFFANSS